MRRIILGGLPSMTDRVVVERTGDEGLKLVEPTTEELCRHAPALADFYNEPQNRALLTNEHAFEPDDVVEQYREMQEDGGRAFLLFAHDMLFGDCDFRHLEGGEAEFAVLVGSRDVQGRGFGTRFSTLAHAFAFGGLGLVRTYVSVRPENAGSLRMLSKVGYRLDETPPARRFADAEDDVCMSVDREAFRRAQPGAMEGVVVRAIL